MPQLRLQMCVCLWNSRRAWLLALLLQLWLQLLLWLLRTKCALQLLDLLLLW